MTPPLEDRASVDAAVASLQGMLEEGDPSDPVLRSQGQAALTALRAAYRAHPSAFSPDAIAALRELADILTD